MSKSSVYTTNGELTTHTELCGDEEEGNRPDVLMKQPNFETVVAASSLALQQASD